MNIKQMIRQLVHDRDGTDLETRKVRHRLASLMRQAKTKAWHNHWRDKLQTELREQEEQREKYNQLIYSLIEKTK